MAIVVSKEPALFIQPKELVVYHRQHKTYFVALSEIVDKVGDLKEIVKTVLSNLLSRLQEFSISFRSIDLNVERDPEIASWRFVETKVELEAEEKVFDEISDLLTDYAYSGLSKEDATKVLLVLTRV